MPTGWEVLTMSGKQARVHGWMEISTVRSLWVEFIFIYIINKNLGLGRSSAKN
jgi:hypothetical protein